jgi:hypothetical protein
MTVAGHAGCRVVRGLGRRSAAGLKGGAVKHIRLVGLCSVAAFALSALAGTSVTSAQPIYGKCRLLSKNTTPKAKKGKYTDPNCQTFFAKKGKPVAKGNYEFEAGPPKDCIALKNGEYTDATCTSKSVKAHKGAFEREVCFFSGCSQIGAFGSVVALEVASGPTIECASHEFFGEILSATTANGFFVYFNCKAPALGGAECENVGAGEIVTSELLAVPEVKDGKVWIDYTAKEPGAAQNGKQYLIEAGCGSASIRVEGNLAARDSGNENKQSGGSTQTFEKAVEGIEGQELTIEAKLGGGFGSPENAWLRHVSLFEGESEYEIKTTPWPG